jgi:hypothetical protein
MFTRLSNKLSEISCRTLLGRTARERVGQLRTNSPTLSEKEAELLASAEVVDSLRSEGVDATSYSDVDAWSKRFLARAHAQDQTTQVGDWNGVLKTCDFAMTADELRHMLKMTQEGAAAKGEEAYFKSEFLEVLYPFMENPSASTEIRLLEIAPFLLSYFERCSPGGDFYETKRFLGGS